MKGNGKQMPAFMTIDGFGKVKDIVDSIGDQLIDLRPLWFLLANDFYKDEKRIFKLKGPGRYEDLTPEYQDRKAQLHGFIYPILRAKGNLERSLTNPADRDAIHIFTKTSMIIGSSSPTAKFHHLGTRNMPVRPLWEINPRSRLGERWGDTADAYFEKVLNRAAKSPRRKNRTF